MVDEPKPEDKMRDKVARDAQQCLDHVRAVEWGRGVAAYNITSRGIEYSVHIEITALGLAKKEG